MLIEEIRKVGPIQWFKKALEIKHWLVQRFLGWKLILESEGAVRLSHKNMQLVLVEQTNEIAKLDFFCGYQVKW
jgi:hypothetical protein